MRIYAELIVVLFSLFALKAFAVDYGAVRVRIVKENAEHKTKVRLNLNSKFLMAFAHANKDPLTQSVDQGHLAQGSGSSLLSSDYSGLEQGCSFQFTIFYGASSSGPWVELGTYDAPSTNVNKTVPIGICADGKVCSSNPTIQNQIVEARIREEKRLRAEELNHKQKAETNARKLAAEESARLKCEAREKARRAASESTEPKAETEQLNGQTDRFAQEKPDEVVGPQKDTNTLTDDEAIAKVVDAMANGGDISWLKDLREDQLSLRMGVAVWLVDTLDAISHAIRGIERTRTMTCGSGSPNSACDELFRQWAEMQQKKQQVGHSGAIIAMAVETGARFTPGLNDVIDFCEAVSGRELCHPSGRKLSGLERGLAAMGMVAGSGKLYRELAVKFPWLKPLLSENIVEQTKNWTPRALEHVLAGEIHTTNGRKVLGGGMHTVDGWNAFREASGVEALRTHVLPNGVQVLELGKEAFSPNGFDRALRAANARGFEHPVKTLFPAHWSPEKIVGAVGEAAENGQIIKTNGSWGIQKVHNVHGVDIQVNLNSGRVDSAFPLTPCKGLICASP